MSIRALIGWTLAACVLTGAARTRAEAPPYIPIQGYLANAAGTPVDGAVAIRFRLYDAATAGTVLFEENKPVVNVEDGYFTVYLGEDSSIDLSVFREHPIVFVGVLVSGDTVELSPRLQLATAPYAAFAQSCGDASTVGGKSASAFMPASPTAGTIPWTALASLPSGLNDGDNDTLGGLSCAEGKVVKRTAGAWACGDDADTDTNTTYSAGSGLTLSGQQFSLSPCNPGEVLKREGGSWVCDSDSDALGSLACSNGQVAKWNGSAWACARPPSSSFHGTTGNFTLSSGTNFILPITVQGSGSCFFIATAALDDGAATTSPSWLWPAIQTDSGTPATQGTAGMQMYPLGSATTVAWTFDRTSGVTYKVGCGIVNNSTATKARCVVVSYCF